MGNDSIIAFRTREQQRKYLGIFSPQFKGSRWNMEFLGQIASTTNGRGIFVYDRGGDGMFGFYIRHGLDFIVRLVGNRYLLNWGGKTEKSQVLARDLAADCTMP